MTTNPSPARSLLYHSVSALGRDPRSRMFLRIVLGLAGAALILFPIASGNNYTIAVAGLVMFVVAILMPQPKQRITLGEKARELGALAVVDGGRYRVPNSSSAVPVQLFVAAERVSVLDAKFRVLLEIPTAEISSFLVLQAEEGWFLEVIWSTYAAEFSYRGTSAQRLAHIAEDAIGRVAPPPAPEVPQRRAAGA